MHNAVTIHVDRQPLTITVLEDRPDGGARLDLEDEHGRKWRVVATATGDLDYIETTWRDDQLADLAEPDWLEDVLVRLAAPA